MASGTVFKADRNQLFALLAMLAAIFTFAAGEILIGVILFVVAAVFSIGGLFWNAHAQDVKDKEDARDAAASPTVRQQEPK